MYVCLGRHPVAGCGRVLTEHERHYYGACCEDCERAWGDRITAWNDGADDAELDSMFSVPMTKQ